MPCQGLWAKQCVQPPLRAVRDEESRAGGTGCCSTECPVPGSLGRSFPAWLCCNVSVRSRQHGAAPLLRQRLCESCRWSGRAEARVVMCQQVFGRYLHFILPGFMLLFFCMWFVLRCGVDCRWMPRLVGRLMEGRRASSKAAASGLPRGRAEHR